MFKAIVHSLLFTLLSAPLALAQEHEPTSDGFPSSAERHAARAVILTGLFQEMESGIQGLEEAVESGVAELERATELYADDEDVVAALEAAIEGSTEAFEGLIEYFQDASDVLERALAYPSGFDVTPGHLRPVYDARGQLVRTQRITTVRAEGGDLWLWDRTDTVDAVGGVPAETTLVVLYWAAEELHTPSDSSGDAFEPGRLESSPGALGVCEGEDNDCDGDRDAGVMRWFEEVDIEGACYIER